MSKHTPGPWLVAGTTVYALNPRDFNRFCAQVQDAHTPIAELQANARLIAAAPDLLESLTNLAGLARLGAARLDKYLAALADAESAIAKARGDA